MMNWTLNKRTIARDDLVSLSEFELVRRTSKAQLVELKKKRRVACGPFATFYFENFATMWWQIHEMLRIEKGGEAQIEDELRAYAPMVPNGRELVATVMFEIEDPVQRHHTLVRLSGVENHIALQIGGDVVKAVAEQDLDRTKESDGKTSSVHFLHFPLTAAQAAAFRDPAVTVLATIDHPDYAHMAKLSPAAREELGRDLD